MYYKHIYVCGDVHGDFDTLNLHLEELSIRHKEERILLLQCGDFGYFWNVNTDDPSAFRQPKDTITIPDNLTLIWTPGNHENWDSLNPFKRGRLHKLQKRLYLATFGATILVNGRKFFFAPGADSIDKHFRTEKISWWRDEVITYADMLWYERHPNNNVDVIISHTCPSKFGNPLPTKYGFKKEVDPSKEYLDILLLDLKPTEWYYGHYHLYKEKQIKVCINIALNMLGEEGWLKKI